MLRLARTAEAMPEKRWLPAYYFDICLTDGTKIGACDLRIGHNDKTYIGGNIGYAIAEQYRGHRYAAQACRLLFRLAARHRMEYLIITCDPANTASALTCQIAGGQYVETASIPEDNEMYAEGKREVMIYRFDLTEGRERVLSAIMNRRSYRGKFLPTPVPRENLRRIMEAGLAAPSGCNRQTTSLIAVDDPGTLERLHNVIRPPVGETAPAAICVLTRQIIAYRDRCFAVQDYAAAIENMLLAITALGYESCWYEGHITDTDRIGEQMARILGVPEEYELVCFLPVGIAEGRPVEPRKKTFEERAWFNAFPASGDAADP